MSPVVIAKTVKPTNTKGLYVTVKSPLGHFPVNHAWDYAVGHPENHRAAVVEFIRKNKLTDTFVGGYSNGSGTETVWVGCASTIDPVFHIPAFIISEVK